MAKLAFLGLGVMGGPMAGHLQKAGHDVTVYNRTAAKAEDWVKVSASFDNINKMVAKAARAITPKAA